MHSFETTRFGVLEYTDDSVIDLPEGLIGLPHLRRWLLLDMDQDLPMRWMQSLDHPDFGVPVMPPVFFTEEYELGTSSASASSADLVTMIIATIHAGGVKVTGNLRAPIVVDISTRRGAQLALDDDRLSTKQEIDQFKFGLAVSGESLDNTETEGSTVAVEAKTETEAEAEAEAEVAVQVL